MDIKDVVAPTPKTPPLVKWGLAVLSAALLLIAASWLGSYLVVVKDGEVFDYTAPVYVTDASLKTATQFKSGDAIVIHYPVERHARRCWATYIDVLKGPVDIQFNERRSSYFLSKSQKLTIKALQVLPAQTPVGRYEVVQLVYPTCEGYTLQPYRTDTGVFIQITK